MGSGAAGGGFVGRAAELELLAGQAGAAGRGEGRVVLIGGEPGIGKTRLSPGRAGPGGRGDQDPVDRAEPGRGGTRARGRDRAADARQPLLRGELGRLHGLAPKAARPGALPDAVRDTLRVRLHSLTPAGRDVLCAAVVLGAAVDPAAVAAVTGRDVAAVLAALDEAAAAGLVAGGDGWSFGHDLIRETARLELPTADRLAVHARMARGRDRRAGRPRPDQPADRRGPCTSPSAPRRTTSSTSWPSSACASAPRSPPGPPPASGEPDAAVRVAGR
jgi:hypothetical protein